MASQAEIKQRRGKMLSKLTKVRRRAFVIIDNRGSRTQLTSMLKELDEALEHIEEVNDEFKAVVADQEELVTEAEEYLKAATSQHEEAYDRIQQYLQSRKGEAPSLASENQGSQTSSSRRAEVLVQVKEMKIKQLQQRHEREKQESEIHRENEMQTAKEAMELAKLEAKLETELTMDNLNWERRNDFEGELGVGQQSSAVPDSAPDPPQKPKSHENPLQEPSDEPQISTRQDSRSTDALSEPLFLRSLPRITLPKFTGSPGDWPKWFALFKTLVHNQKSLNPTEKMAHLQNSVGGPAAQAIGGMFYEGSLYEEALRTLEDRFGRAEDIVGVNLNPIPGGL